MDRSNKKVIVFTIRHGRPTPQNSGRRHSAGPEGMQRIPVFLHRLRTAKSCRGCQPFVNRICNTTYTRQTWFALKGAKIPVSAIFSSIHSDSRPRDMDLNKRKQIKDLIEQLSLSDKSKETKAETEGAPSNLSKQNLHSQSSPVQTTSWPRSQLLRARIFWQDSLVGPAKRMTAQELGIALGIGVWGGLFPVPSATTVVVAAILTLSRLVGIKIQPAAAALAIAVNLALTPVQVRLCKCCVPPECCSTVSLRTYAVRNSWRSFPSS